MKYILLLFCTLLTPTITAHAQNWKIHTLRSNIVGAWSRTADFNKDGKPDILVQSGDTILWYENLQPGWVEHIVDATFENSAYALVQLADMDNDGDMDILKAPTSDTGKDTLSWNENQNNGAVWVKHNIIHIIGKATELPDCVGDLDGDGDMDIAFAEFVFVNNEPIGQLFWIENNGLAGVWEKHVLRPGSHWYCSLGDMDRDGDLDILASGGRLLWLENQLPDTTWTSHDIAPGSFLTHHYVGQFADFNGDGTLDPIATPATNTQVTAVYLSPNWQQVPVGILSNLYYSAIGDLDEDGDLDAFYGGVGNSFRKMGWVENQNGGTKWVIHDIAAGSNLQRAPTGLADIDGDGDKDLVALTFNLNTNLGSVFWGENPRIMVGTLEAGRLPDPLNITPSLTSDFVKIQSPVASTGTWKGELCAEDGRLLRYFETTGDSVYDLDVRDLEPGIFIVKMTSDKGQYALGRFVKQ